MRDHKAAAKNMANGNGKSNGHTNGESKEAKPVEEPLFKKDSVFDMAAEGPPLKPKPVEYVTGGQPYLFYKSLRGKWAQWWDEFISELEPGGKLKYRTAMIFIRSKTKVAWEQELLYEMIGPRPEIDPDGPRSKLKSKLRVPWLGDWEERRRLGFWSFEEAKKFVSIKRAFQERQTSIDAARAIVPLLVSQLTRYERVKQKIDEVYGFNPMNPNQPPGPKNQARVKGYLELLKTVQEQELQYFKEYYRAHGLNPEAPQDWLNIAALDGVQLPANGNGRQLPGQPQTIDGEVVQAVTLPQGCSVDDLLLAKMLRAKAKAYNMKLPGELNAMVDPLTQDEINKAKKKVQ